MNIIYFGNGVRGLTCFKALMNAGEKIVAVVGHPGDKTDVVKYADEHDIPAFQPEDVNDSRFLKVLQHFRAELFILSGYNRILKSEIINLPSLGCINLHGGKLPEYRGCAPINWQIINGETVGGCCIIFVDEGIDTGPVIIQEYYEISEDDTSLDIVNKQLELFPTMLLNVVQEFKEGTVQKTPQDRESGCYYTRRYPQDSLINWDTMTARQVYNFVRALVDPYPNAFTFFEGKKVRIKKARLMKPPIKGIPGRIPLKTADGAVVCCKDESLIITEVAFGDEDTTYNPNDIFKIGSEFKPQ